MPPPTIAQKAEAGIRIARKKKPPEIRRTSREYTQRTAKCTKYSSEKIVMQIQL